MENKWGLEGEDVGGGDLVGGVVANNIEGSKATFMLAEPVRSTGFGGDKFGESREAVHSELLTQLVAADGGSGPNEACHNDDEDQDKKKETEEVQEETPAKVITLEVVYEELQILKHTIYGSMSVKVLKKLDIVNAMASKVEPKIGKEKEEPEDDAAEATKAAETAASGMLVGGYIFRWFAERAFGFARVAGCDVFVHLSTVRGGVADIIGKQIVMKIVEDKTRGDEIYRALTAVREADYLEEVTRD